MDETIHLALRLCSNGDHHASGPQRRLILGRIAFADGFSQLAVQRRAQRTLTLPDLASDAEQRVGCVIADRAVIVNNSAETRLQVGERIDATRALRKRGVVGLAVGKVARQALARHQNLAYGVQRLGRDVRVFGARFA